MVGNLQLAINLLQNVENLFWYGNCDVFGGRPLPNYVSFEIEIELRLNWTFLILKIKTDLLRTGI